MEHVRGPMVPGRLPSGKNITASRRPVCHHPLSEAAATGRSLSQSLHEWMFSLSRHWPWDCTRKWKGHSGPIHQPKEQKTSTATQARTPAKLLLSRLKISNFFSLSWFCWNICCSADSDASSTSDVNMYICRDDESQILTSVQYPSMQIGWFPGLGW